MRLRSQQGKQVEQTHFFNEGTTIALTATDKQDSDLQQDPNDAAFQFVVLASPEELQVSLDKRDSSHYDVFSGCDSVVGEEGPHTVQMVCTDFSEDSSCHKIGLGYGVPGTILQMPVGCGPGKHAVAKDTAPTPDQKKVILPRHLKHLSAHTPIVSDFAFDYDFRCTARFVRGPQRSLQLNPVAILFPRYITYMRADLMVRGCPLLPPWGPALRVATYRYSLMKTPLTMPRKCPPK